MSNPDRTKLADGDEQATEQALEHGDLGEFVQGELDELGRSTPTAPRRTVRASDQESDRSSYGSDSAQR